jgi:uncharacterized protein YjiS (DUF1127 family)
LPDTETTMTDILKSPWVAPGIRPAPRRWRDRLRRWGHGLWRWRERRRTALILHRLDDRVLRDIGLLRTQIDSFVRELECDFVPAKWPRRR